MEAALFEGVNRQEVVAGLDWDFFVFREIQAGGVAAEETFVLADLGGVQDTTSTVSPAPVSISCIRPDSGSLRGEVVLGWIGANRLVSCLLQRHRDFANMGIGNSDSATEETSLGPQRRALSSVFKWRMTQPRSIRRF